MNQWNLNPYVIYEIENETYPYQWRRWWCSPTSQKHIYEAWGWAWIENHDILMLSKSKEPVRKEIDWEQFTKWSTSLPIWDRTGWVGCIQQDDSIIYHKVVAGKLSKPIAKRSLPERIRDIVNRIANAQDEDARYQ